VKDELSQILKAHIKKPITLKDFKASAVLAPLFTKNSEDYLLFTVRNEKVRHHKGEICFPGGVFDPSDHDLLRTALRECEEELGIQKKDIEILGELDDLITPTMYRISPYVGRIPHPYPFEVNPREIAELFEVPLSHFLNEKNLKLKRVEYFGEKVEIPFYEWKHHNIWGATARVVKQLVELINPLGPAKRDPP
jgi:8-oxo-dGTP pyrophosphatase MutT (NUDIX family)